MHTLIKLMLFLVSLACSLIIAELAARYILDPVDYLLPQLEADEVLNHRIVPSTGGHDVLGFRNHSIPERVSTVAVGDSMTYGIAATAHNSWPSQYSRMTGKVTYNMGLGGYGPLQYLHLSKLAIQRLDPDEIIVALYLGNDLMDAYNLAETNPNWKSFRASSANQEVKNALSVFQPSEHDDRFLGSTRNYLSQNSLIYRLLTQVQALNAFRVAEQVGDDQTIPRLRLSDQKHLYFKYSARSPFLDLNDPRIQAGVDISLASLKQIAKEARKEGVSIVIAIIPTKERVYARWLVRAYPNDTKLRNVLYDEDEVRNQLLFATHAMGLRSVDLLEAMESAAAKYVLYPPTDDHPNLCGYRVIAAELAGFDQRGIDSASECRDLLWSTLGG